MVWTECCKAQLSGWLGNTIWWVDINYQLVLLNSLVDHNDIWQILLNYRGDWGIQFNESKLILNSGWCCSSPAELMSVQIIHEWLRNWLKKIDSLALYTSTCLALTEVSLWWKQKLSDCWPQGSQLGNFKNQSLVHQKLHLHNSHKSYFWFLSVNWISLYHLISRTWPTSLLSTWLSNEVFHSWCHSWESYLISSDIYSLSHNL